MVFWLFTPFSPIFTHQLLNFQCLPFISSKFINSSLQKQPFIAAHFVHRRTLDLKQTLCNDMNSRQKHSCSNCRSYSRLGSELD